MLQSHWDALESDAEGQQPAEMIVATHELFFRKVHTKGGDAKLLRMPPGSGGRLHMSDVCITVHKAYEDVGT